MSSVDIYTPGQTWHSIQTYSPLCSRGSFPWLHIQRRVDEKDRSDGHVKISSPNKTQTCRTCPEDGQPFAPSDTSPLSSARTSEAPWTSTNIDFAPRHYWRHFCNQSICEIYGICFKVLLQSNRCYAKHNMSVEYIWALTSHSKQTLVLLTHRWK